MVGLGRCYGINLFEEEREQYLMILGSSLSCLLTFLWFLPNCKPRITQHIDNIFGRDELGPPFICFERSNTGNHRGVKTGFDCRRAIMREAYKNLPFDQLTSYPIGLNPSVQQE